MMTAKHMRLINTNDNSQNLPLNAHTCICGKEYKHAPSLSKHKKSCTYTPPSLPTSPENTITYTVEPIEPTSAELLVLIKELMKQNMELQNTMKEMIPPMLMVLRSMCSFSSKTIVKMQRAFRILLSLSNLTRNIWYP